MSEFEDRETQLGELPEPIARERGELYSDKGADFPPNQVPLGQQRYRTPPDVRVSNNAQDDNRSFSGQPQTGLVTSTFDTRPINARDFHETATDYTTTNLEVNNLIAMVHHTVPNGYVGLLRGFKYRSLDTYYLHPSLIDIIGAYPISMSILVDNNPVPGYSNIKPGLYLNDFLPIHLLVPATKTITLAVTTTQVLTDQLFPSGGKNWFALELYGQHLKSRGLPTEFENSSQI